MALTSHRKAPLARTGRNWVAPVGVWDFSKGHCIYKSPQDPQWPYGICASNVQFSEGTARATIRFLEVDPNGVEVCGRILFGYRSLADPYLGIGLGGADREYNIYEYDPAIGWRPVALAGSRKNLKADHPYKVSARVQDKRVFLEVDSVQVLEHVLETPLPRGQFGLFAWGTTSVEFTNISVRHKREPSEDAGARIDTEAVEQIAAAFRFGIQDNKIDVLPENLETLDPAISQDLYDELVTKAQTLDARLKRSNADPHAGFAVERLLLSLGARYDDVRPGVVLSRLRSIESIVSGFDTEEGRAALFPDTIAMFTDLHLSGQDFLAAFPNVRRIERQRIAAGLEKDPAVIERVLEETKAIHAAAVGSEIVTPGAAEALGENEPEIRGAQNVEVKADLVADHLLIHRNFVSQVLRAIARKSGDAWEVVGPDFIVGSKAAARMFPPLAVIALITTIVGPIVGLAGLLRSDLFKSVRGAVTKVRRSASTPRRTGRHPDKDDTAQAD
jgi:hypothetical protein